MVAVYNNVNFIGFIAIYCLGVIYTSFPKDKSAFLNRTVDDITNHASGTAGQGETVLFH